MSRRRRALAVPLLAVMLQLVAGMALAARVVVCRAPSGHLEIESVLDGDCCPAVESEPLRQELRADACSGCFDTPLLHAGFSTSNKAAFDALVPASWALAPAPVLRHVLSHAPGPAVAASPPGRTVVLLI